MMFGVSGGKRKEKKLKSKNGWNLHDDEQDERIENEEDSKCSFYVWFLGVCESQGVCGSDYIQPIVSNFLQNQRINPRKPHHITKLTLTVSSKSLVIFESEQCNAVRRTCSGIIMRRSKETSTADKLMIAPDGIVSVYQSEFPNDDIVSAILLLPTKRSGMSSPFLVHCFRCDSAETASHLSCRLKMLSRSSSNSLLASRIEALCLNNGDVCSSDSGGSSDLQNSPSTLYDNLATELRQKLAGKIETTPLLLPPRDYDTIHRQHGNVVASEYRRARNPIVVGKKSGDREIGTPRKEVEEEEERSSSGIGSEDNNNTESGSQEVSKSEKQQSTLDPSLKNVDENVSRLRRNLEGPIFSISSYTDSPTRLRLSTTRQLNSELTTDANNNKNQNNGEKTKRISQSSSTNISRKHSFHELQQKFRLLEQRGVSKAAPDKPNLLRSVSGCGGYIKATQSKLKNGQFGLQRHASSAVTLQDKRNRVQLRPRRNEDDDLGYASRDFLFGEVSKRQEEQRTSRSFTKLKSVNNGAAVPDQRRWVSSTSHIQLTRELSPEYRTTMWPRNPVGSYQRVSRIRPRRTQNHIDEGEICSDDESILEFHYSLGQKGPYNQRSRFEQDIKIDPRRRSYAELEMFRSAYDAPSHQRYGVSTFSRKLVPRWRQSSSSPCRQARTNLTSRPSFSGYQRNLPTYPSLGFLSPANLGRK